MNKFCIKNSKFIKISGPDRDKLLQGQITCDIFKINQSKSRIAAICNPKGRAISSFRIFAIQDSYILEVNYDMVDIIIGALTKYAPFYKVEINSNEEIKSICISAESIEPLLEEINTLYPNCQIIKNNYETISFDVYAAPEEIKQITNLLLKSGSNELNTLATDINIKNKIAFVSPETSELLTPHKLGLHHLNAIDFDKGCYTGQEIIARMHYKSDKEFDLKIIECDKEPIIGSKNEDGRIFLDKVRAGKAWMALLSA